MSFLTPVKVTYPITAEKAELRVIHSQGSRIRKRISRSMRAATRVIAKPVDPNFSKIWRSMGLTSGNPLLSPRLDNIVSARIKPIDKRRSTVDPDKPCLLQIRFV